MSADLFACPAARARYAVEGLAFGGATLSRDTHGALDAVTLRARLPSGPAEFRLPVRPARGGQRYAAHALGIRALLAEHRLLARPAWLTAPELPEMDAASLAALRVLRGVLDEVVTRVDSTQPAYRCAACLPPSVRRARGPAPDEAPPTSDCPHVAMRAAALRALLAAHPELAAELAGLAEPADGGYRVERGLLASLLRAWLEGAVQRVDTPAVQRDVRSFARAAWAFPAGDPPGPRRGASADPAAWDAPALRAPVAVAVALPEPPAKPAPEPPAKPAPAKPTPVKAAPVKPAPAKEPAPAPAAKDAAPKGVYMAKDLAAMGHGPAAQKRMLKDGTLVREGFGWYRFARAP